MRRGCPVLRPVVVRSMTWLRFSAALVSSSSVLLASTAGSSRPERPRERRARTRGGCRTWNRRAPRVTPRAAPSVVHRLDAELGQLAHALAEVGDQLRRGRLPPGDLLDDAQLRGGAVG